MSNHRRAVEEALVVLLLAFATTSAAAQAERTPESDDRSTGTLVVLNKGESTATFVDVATGSIVATLPTGEGPHELAMTRDGRWAVSTDYGGGNSLTVFDVAEPRVVETIDLRAYPRPHGAAFLSGDSLMVVTSEASRSVVLVAPFRGDIAGSIPTGADGSHMVAATADGSTLYTGDIGDDTVSRLDVEARERTGVFGVPAEPEAIAVTADGSEVWVGSNAEGLISVVDPRTGTVTSPLAGFEWPYRILIVEERGLVVIPDLRREVLRFVDHRERTDVKTLELPGHGPQGVALTDDAATLFLSLNRSGQVAVVDLETLEIVRHIAVGPTPDGIGWSPVVISEGGPGV